MNTKSLPSESRNGHIDESIYCLLTIFDVIGD